VRADWAMAGATAPAFCFPEGEATVSLAIGGTLAFAAGVVALSRSQPYTVYYPLLLIGFLATAIPLGVRPSIRRRYEEIELRRMRAHDLG
jgi:hypothetical protein